MALHLDTIENSGYLLTPRGKRFRRTAVVTGVSTADPALVPFLATQVSGMPQYGDPHPADPQCRLTDIEALGIVEATDTIRVLLTYSVESGNLNLPGSTPNWVYEDDTTISAETTELVPGPDKSPIIVSWRDPESLRYYDYQASITYRRPIRVITLTGKPAVTANLDRIRDQVGKVNSDKFLNKDPGYWLFARLYTRVVAGQRSIVAQITTKNNEDWSEWQSLRDRNTDQFVKINPDDVTNLKGKSYQYGLQYPGGGNQGGIVRVGPAEMTSFAAIFS